MQSNHRANLSSTVPLTFPNGLEHKHSPSRLTIHHLNEKLDTYEDAMPPPSDYLSASLHRERSKSQRYLEASASKSAFPSLVQELQKAETLGGVSYSDLRYSAPLEETLNRGAPLASHHANVRPRRKKLSTKVRPGLLIYPNLISSWRASSHHTISNSLNRRRPSCPYFRILLTGTRRLQTSRPFSRGQILSAP